jgi:(S)-2-hydroxy-acid oxidase
MNQVITGVIDYETQAEKRLPSDSYGYFVSGSDDEVTLRNNIRAFSDIYLHPRVLVDMAHLSTKTSILGHPTDLPFGIAPFALQKLLHPEGELITAREAGRQNTAYGLSMLTTTKPGDVAKVNPSGIKILQLYFLNNAEYTLDVIRLAERLGFHAFAITVDTQIFGKRRRDERAVFQPKVTL